MPRRRKSDAEWQAVFRLRCKSKSGGVLSAAEQALVERAYQEDAGRYGDMEVDVFNATVPFGSNVRREKDRMIRPKTKRKRCAECGSPGAPSHRVAPGHAGVAVLR